MLSSYGLIDDWLDVELNVCVNVANKKNCAGKRLKVDLRQLASRLNQNKTTEKTEATFFLKSVIKKKRFEFAS